MKSILLLSTLMLLGSCTPSAEVTSGSSTSEPRNPDAPFIWKNKTFPKSVRISSNFSDNEVLAITRMGTAWKTAVEDKKTFFSYGDRINNAHNIDDTDGVFGIYRTTNWPADVDDSALAITQLFGRRYNVGDADEYVGIEEADILVNYSFDFNILDDAEDDDDMDDKDYGFDLQTVVLHEMGHFLGLSHVTSWYDLTDDEQDAFDDKDAYKESSVMYPSISSSERKREPQLRDINALVEKYSIAISGSGTIGSNSTRYQPKNNDPGKKIRFVIELRKDGECVHKENGVIFKRHSVNLKRK